jgi:hypothetical protein
MAAVSDLHRAAEPATRFLLATEGGVGRFVERILGRHAKGHDTRG